MAKKRYKIEHTELFDTWVILEVDHDRLTPALASEINSFWSGKEARLADANDDPVKAVIKMAGGIFIAYVLDVFEGLNAYGMQRGFDALEGWPPAGSHGIRLIEWQGRPDLDEYLLEMKELE